MPSAGLRSAGAAEIADAASSRSPTEDCGCWKPHAASTSRSAATTNDPCMSGFCNIAASRVAGLGAKGARRSSLPCDGRRAAPRLRIHTGGVRPRTRCTSAHPDGPLRSITRHIRAPDTLRMLRPAISSLHSQEAGGVRRADRWAVPCRLALRLCTRPRPTGCL